MDDYTREMMDLKTLVTRTLEKKGVLAKIRAELRASVFEAIEEEDRVIEKEEGLPPALLGSCNDRAKQLHASPLVSSLGMHQKDSWKAELEDFSGKSGYDLNRNGNSGPVLLDVLEGFLKFDNISQARGTGRRLQETEPSSSLESRNTRRPSSSTVSVGLPPLGRCWSNFTSCSQPLFRIHLVSDYLMYWLRNTHLRYCYFFSFNTFGKLDRRAGSSVSGYRKDEYSWRYDEDTPEDVIRASTALENLQLDRKARNLTTSWRFVPQLF
ncbi:protein TONNEAU 1a-like isoform X1 [Gossypium australe]|uniref:Protein TONNEAU 1a-like isoform X1 n=1 Tax=Gossypium australe TaxID=47621 RepID=A0A5B6V4Q5_9ROSI|nr:protein TONNEAU 1a-like isoform X1 [Gossypium australe]